MWELKIHFCVQKLSEVKFLYCYAGLSELPEVTGPHCYQKYIQSCPEGCPSLLMYIHSAQQCMFITVCTK